MKSLNSQYDVESLGPVEKLVVPTWQQRVGNYFVNAVMLLAGAFLGAILALLIGMFTGWIEISC